MGRRPKNSTVEKQCTFHGCAKPVKALGLCMHHYCGSYSQGKCKVHGCYNKARSRRMCEMHYKRSLRSGSVEIGDEMAWMSPSCPYVKDLSETSSYYDCETDSSSSASTPRLEGNFALATEPSYLLDGDVSFDDYRSLFIQTKAVCGSKGSESSPGADLY